MISADGVPLTIGQTCYVRRGPRNSDGFWNVQVVSVTGVSKKSLRLTPADPDMASIKRTPSKVWINRLQARGVSDA
jgi:hypothetical protein